VKFSSEALARSAAEHPWRTVAIWLAVLVLGFALFGALFSTATTAEQDFTNNPEAKRARQLLEDHGLVGPRKFREIAIVRNDGLTVDNPAFKEKVTALTQQLRDLGTDKVESATNFYETGAPGMVSPGRNSTIIPITLAGDADTVRPSIQALLKVTDQHSTGGYDISVAGAASIGEDFREVADNDLRRGEFIGIAAALVILLLVFRSLGSAWIPIVMAIFAIVLAGAASAVIGQVYKLSFFVLNIITMIGLAVGIDYTLFIVARYREERANGLAKSDAIAKAGATAGRAVFFSGVTVVFALLGMLIVPTTIFFSLGLGAILVVLFAILLSMTLLPAILSLMGDKVTALKLPFFSSASDNHADTRSGFWNWTTRTVLARPAVFLIVTAGALIALTIPYFGIKLGFNGVDTLPDKFESKHAFETLIRDFPAALGDIASLDLVVAGDAGSQANRDGLDRLKAELKSDLDFGEPQAYTVSDDGEAGLMRLFLTVPGDSDEAYDAVRRLRDDHIPAANIPSEALVGSDTAANVDFFKLVNMWQPIVIAVVLALSFVLLMIVFRSVVVPVKAIILNLLSVGAAYGLMVLVFQRGFAAGVLGFQQVEVIDAWIPLFLFSVLFGLSMDYEVFLLSRIRERYDQTHNNEECVAFGLRSTARIITGAALIMVAVFGGFALGEFVSFQQFGFGLGVAVLVDATVIRSVLVPSTMKLLGNANWYLPKFLNWLPDLRVEVREPAHASLPAAPQATPAAAPAGGANGRAQKS